VGRAPPQCDALCRRPFLFSPLACSSAAAARCFIIFLQVFLQDLLQHDTLCCCTTSEVRIPDMTTTDSHVHLPPATYTAPHWPLLLPCCLPIQ
jgi:hypothetical protein